MLRIENVSLNYHKPILKEISFAVDANQIVGIAGQSGAGKTSLLKIIAGLADASSGEVSLEGKRVVGPSMRLIPGHPEIQLVNQDFSLDIHQTTTENIRGKILHFPKDLQSQFIEELLDLLELQHVKNQKALLLSGGEQQRLAIARALALEPKILLLDEPFVHLDMQLRLKLINYLIELKQARSMGVIIVSHNSEELLSLCDQIVYIVDGNVKRIDSPHNFYYHYDNLSQARSFGLINEIKMGDQELSFRPDEYEITEDQTIGFGISFERSIFMGSYYLNEFLVENRKKIILLNKEPIQYATRITITRK